MNINFSADPGFSAYVLLLMFSGLAMVLVGSPVVRRQRPLSRFLNIGFGVGFFVYGFYLAFVFDGGHYILFFKAFILPVVLVVRAIASARRQPSTPAPTPHWQNPTPQWQNPAQQSAAFAAPQPQWTAPPAQPGQWTAPPAQPGQWGPPALPSQAQPATPDQPSTPWAPSGQ